MDIKLATSIQDLNGILTLQAANLKGSQPEDNQKKEGFVTVQHDLEILKEMNRLHPQIIAVAENQVIGYALVMGREMQTKIPVLQPMFAMFDHVTYKGKPVNAYNFYVMGQVGIAAGYRGQGIFKGLYHKHKSAYAQIFDFCVTEVSAHNQRSMKAHLNIGFEVIHSFHDTTDHWHILLLPWEHLKT